MAVIRHYESYFPDAKPISSAEFVPSLDGDARVLPESDRIEIHQRHSTSVKICCILVIHELINNKLFKKHGKPQSDQGDEFKAEVRRLWGLGAYCGESNIL